MAKSITASLMILAARKIDSQAEEMTALKMRKMTMGVTMMMIGW
jgi:hypothetical protein